MQFANVHIANAPHKVIFDTFHPMKTPQNHAKNNNPTGKKYKNSFDLIFILF